MLNAKLVAGVSLVGLITALGASPALAQQAGDPQVAAPAPNQQTGAPGAPQAEKPAAEEAADRVVITGSRLANGFETPTPVTMVGADQIESRGAATALDALNDLPNFQNGSGPTRGTGGTFAVGQGLLDLRGLGATRTLVLLDGRRHVPNNTNGTWDTNVLPAGLVERVDVVTGGASAAYGSDAVAGVVNFILKDNLQGVKATLQYGSSEESDYQQVVANFAAGTSFGDGRGRVVFGVDYSHGDPSGNQYSRDWGQSETALIGLPANRAAGLPAFLKADNAHYAIAYGGLVTTCARTVGGVTVNANPCPIANLTFDDGGQPRPFQFGSPRGSSLMVGGENEGAIQFRNQLMGVGSERWATLGRLTYDLSDSLTAWGEVSAGRFHVETRTADYINTGSIIIRRDNPFLPAALATQMDANGITQFNMSRVNYAQQGGVRAGNVNDFWEASGGLRGTIFNDWTWDTHYSFGRARFFYRPRGLTVLPNYLAALYAVRDGSGAITCGPVASNPMFLALQPAQRAAFAGLVSPGCQPFNPFGPNGESADALAYVGPSDTESSTYYDQQAAAVNLAGSPFSTWAGDVSLALGVEWHKDDVETKLSALNAARSLSSAFFAANPQPGAGEQSVTEGYAEVGVPLLADVPFATAVDLNMAVRVADYSASGSVTTWKIGGTWDVTDDLRFRVTRSRDIRAANIPELFYRGNDGFSTQTNPLTGGSNQINSASLNNPNLDPEQADTWTAGFVLTPKWEWARGFQASLDYYSIDMKDVIGTIPVASIISGYYLQGRTDYAQYFTFDASAPAGFTRVNTPQLNLNSLETAGLDLNVSYRVPETWMPVPGELALNFIGSYTDKNKTMGPNNVVLSDGAFTASKYKWTSNINYKVGDFSTTLTARYFSSFHGSFNFIGPDDPRYSPTLSNSVSDNTWPALAYYSLQAQYAFGAGGDRQVVLYGVIDNLLNTDPPAGAFSILEGLGSAATNFSPYDNIGRYFKIGVRFTG